MAHGQAWEGEWRGNWRMDWVASTFHTASEHGVSNITNITTADAPTSAASSRLNWRPRRFKWARPFRRKTKPSFCACVITVLLASTIYRPIVHIWNRNDVVGWSVVVSNSDRDTNRFCSAKVQTGSDAHSGYIRENTSSNINKNVYIYVWEICLQHVPAETGHQQVIHSIQRY